MIIETPRGTSTSYENRVVTNGVVHSSLEVYYTGSIGYGVWSKGTIEKGAFLATYVGEILTITGESS